MLAWPSGSAADPEAGVASCRCQTGQGELPCRPLSWDGLAPASAQAGAWLPQALFPALRPALLPTGATESSSQIRLQAGQVPRALLTWSSSFSHPFPSSFTAFIPFLKPLYVFCTEQPGLLLHREGQGSSGSNILSTALLPRPTRTPLCPTPPASGPALWTPSFSCLSPFSSGVHGPWRFKERTVY